MNALVLIVAIAGVVSLAHADGPTACGYEYQGQVIDLRPLTVSSGADYQSQLDPSGYEFEVNVCAPCTVDSECASFSGTICQTKGGVHVATIAKWPSSGAPSGFVMIGQGRVAVSGPGPGACDPKNLSAGVELQFGNGDPCYPSSQPRTARIQFVCGSGFIETTTAGCDYTVVFPTTYACVNSSGASFSPPPRYINDAELSADGFTQATQGLFQDVNKDGYVDLVYSVYRQDTPSESLNQVYLNNGSAWVSGSSGEWRSPILIDRAIQVIRRYYHAGKLTKREYRDLMVLCAHPKYQGGIETLHRNFVGAAAALQNDEEEFVELALEYLASVQQH